MRGGCVGGDNAAACCLTFTGLVLDTTTRMEAFGAEGWAAASDIRDKGHVASTRLRQNVESLKMTTDLQRFAFHVGSEWRFVRRAPPPASHCNKSLLKSGILGRKMEFLKSVSRKCFCN